MEEPPHFLYSLNFLPYTPCSLLYLFLCHQGIQPHAGRAISKGEVLSRAVRAFQVFQREPTQRQLSFANGYFSKCHILQIAIFYPVQKEFANLFCICLWVQNCSFTTNALCHPVSLVARPCHPQQPFVCSPCLLFTIL